MAGRQPEAFQLRHSLTSVTRTMGIRSNCTGDTLGVQAQIVLSYPAISRAECLALARLVEQERLEQ